MEVLFLIVLFFLFCGLSVIAVIVLVIAKLLGGWRNLWNLITGKGLSANRRKNNYSQGSQQQYSSSENQGGRPHSKGVFSDDEGTYVDFEEVKEIK